MAYLTTFTLDELSDPHIMTVRLLRTGRLDDMDIRIQKGFLITLSEYLSTRGPDTTSDAPNARFKYTVTDSDFDRVVDMFKEGLPK